MSIELGAIIVGLFSGGIVFVYGYGTLNARVDAIREANVAAALAAKDLSERQNERIMIMEKRHYDLDGHVANQLSRMGESLARIEGHLALSNKKT